MEDREDREDREDMESFEGIKAMKKIKRPFSGLPFGFLLLISSACFDAGQGDQRAPKPTTQFQERACDHENLTGCFGVTVYTRSAARGKFAGLTEDGSVRWTAAALTSKKIQPSDIALSTGCYQEGEETVFCAGYPATSSGGTLGKILGYFQDGSIIWIKKRTVFNEVIERQFLEAGEFEVDRPCTTNGTTSNCSSEDD